MKKRVLEIILAVAVILGSIVPIQFVAASESVAANLPSGNLLKGSEFNNSDCLSSWINGGTDQKLSFIADGDGGYILAHDITTNYVGYTYKTGLTLENGYYKFTGYFRTDNQAESTKLRLIFSYSDGTNKQFPFSVGGQWSKVECYIDGTKGLMPNFKICGQGDPQWIQSYRMDNFSLEKISSMPLSEIIVTDYDGSSGSSDQSAAEKTASTGELGTVEPVLKDNLLPYGNFEDKAGLSLWTTNKQSLSQKVGDYGTYLVADGIQLNYVGFNYNAGGSVPAGSYKFTGYFKTFRQGEVSQIRVIFTMGDNTTKVFYVNLSNTWIKTEMYISASAGMSGNIKICGSTSADYVQAYCMDNFSLVKINDSDMPESPATSFGTTVTPAQAKASTNVQTEEWDYEKESKYKVEGLIINQDADGYIGSAVGVTQAQIEEFARSFKGTHVTDYMICINNTNASYPSEVWTSVLDKYYQTTENGVPVNYSNESIMKGAHHIYEVIKGDYIATWIKEFREIGINPWLSIRMNDAHDHGQKTSKLLSDFFHEHPELRRVQHHKSSASYYDNLMDYGQKYVRDYVLALIDEALTRYDPYGIELDFQREIYLFQIGREYDGIEVLNQFMRDVDALVAKHEKERGHEIKIAVRVASDLQTNMDYGLDVMTWVAEGIVSQVTPTARWSTTDNDIPVNTWKALLAPYNVILAPGIECNIVSGNGTTTRNSYETLCGAAANILSQGADRVYLFNMYRSAFAYVRESDKTYYPDSTGNDRSITTNVGYWNVINTMGSYEKLMESNRRVILTYDDTAAIWKNVYRQVPKPVKAGETATIKMHIGDVPSGAKVTLKIGTKGNIQNALPTIYVNSTACKYSGTEACEGGYTKSTLYCFEIPASAASKGIVVAEIINGSAAFNLNHAEVTITVAK